LTEESETKTPETNGSPEPSPELSTPAPFQLPKLSFQQIKESHDMLMGFREGVRDGTYQGRWLIKIAQGLMFLDSIIGQSQAQMEHAKQEQKDAIKKAKETIQSAGGTINNG
jgi:hypothetical protein